MQMYVFITVVFINVVIINVVIINGLDCPAYFLSYLNITGNIILIV